MAPEKVRTIVLDTAAILAGLGPAQGAGTGDPVVWLVPPAVRDEVRPGGPTGRAMERSLAAGLRVETPTEAAFDRVEEAVHGRGETTRLTAADRAVVALALDAASGGAVEIWTDDYAVQNIAKVLGLPTRNVMTQGIREEATWYVRCTGCGRYPETAAADETCPVCGSPLKRTRKTPGGRR